MKNRSDLRAAAQKKPSSETSLPLHGNGTACLLTNDSSTDAHTAASSITGSLSADAIASVGREWRGGKRREESEGREGI